MAFYQVTGQDHRTRSTRTLDVSARNADDAALTAAEHGLVEVKVDPLTDRDLLHRDLACFLYADPMRPKKAHAVPVSANYPPSMLLDRPVTTIALGVALGMLAFAAFEAIVSRLVTILF